MAPSQADLGSLSSTNLKLYGQKLLAWHVTFCLRGLLILIGHCFCQMCHHFPILFFGGRVSCWALLEVCPGGTLWLFSFWWGLWIMQHLALTFLFRSEFCTLLINTDISDWQRLETSFYVTHLVARYHFCTITPPLDPCLFAVLFFRYWTPFSFNQTVEECLSYSLGRVVQSMNHTDGSLALSTSFPFIGFFAHTRLESLGWTTGSSHCNLLLHLSIEYNQLNNPCRLAAPKLGFSLYNYKSLCWVWLSEGCLHWLWHLWLLLEGARLLPARFTFYIR